MKWSLICIVFAFSSCVLFPQKHSNSISYKELSLVPNLLELTGVTIDKGMGLEETSIIATDYARMIIEQSGLSIKYPSDYSISICLKESSAMNNLSETHSLLATLTLIHTPSKVIFFYAMVAKEDKSSLSSTITMTRLLEEVCQLFIDARSLKK